MLNRFIPISTYEKHLPLLAEHYRGQKLLDELLKIERFNTTGNTKENIASIPYISYDFDELQPTLKWGKPIIRFNVNEYGKTMK